MEPVEKLWSEVDSLKEARIRHDERMKKLEASDQKHMEHFAKLEKSIEDTRSEIRTGFATIGKRIDQAELNKSEQAGYKKGQTETRTTMLKQFGLWLTIGGLIASFVYWLLNRGGA